MGTFKYGSNIIIKRFLILNQGVRSAKSKKQASNVYFSLCVFHT